MAATTGTRDMLKGYIRFQSMGGNGWTETYHMKTLSPNTAILDLQTICHLRAATMPSNVGIVYSNVSLTNKKRDSRAVALNSDIIEAYRPRRLDAGADHIGVGYSFRFETDSGDYVPRIFRGLCNTWLVEGRTALNIGNLQYAPMVGWIVTGRGGAGMRFLHDIALESIPSSDLALGDTGINDFWYNDPTGEPLTNPYLISAGAPSGGDGTTTGGTSGTGSGGGTTGTGTSGGSSPTTPPPNIGGVTLTPTNPMPNAQGQLPVGPNNQAPNNRFQEFNGTADDALPGWLARRPRDMQDHDWMVYAWTALMRVIGNKTLYAKNLDKLNRIWTTDDWTKILFMRVSHRQTGRPFGVSRGRR